MAITGATSASFPIDSAQPSRNGSYTLVIENAAGSTTSSIAEEPGSKRNLSG